MSVGHSGVGSWPGTDLAGAVRLTLGELPGAAYVPELPGRGPGADMIGRALGAVTVLGADLQPTGWRLVEGSSMAQRRARALLRDDLDVLEEQAQGFEGGLRLTLTGPLTLAAAVELPRGGPALADPGATRDLRDALAEASADLVADVARRVPGAEVSLQWDEPMLGSIRTGGVRSASGLRRLPAWGSQEIIGHLRPLVDRLAAAGLDPSRTLVHSCAPGPGIDDLVAAGVGGVGVDVDQLARADLDAIAALLEGGRILHLGVARTVPVDTLPTADALAGRALSVLRPLELGPAIADRVVLTPACGLAGWTERPATQLLRRLGSAAGIVDEELSR
ncbi:methionine synthase [Raineyella fluvialis]|uniref:Methionine synthase n=1 Tax=Raineyella fluvialis TaxID=2662261 RepID=A0A5Q2FIJ7_9ACTN|nr:methionine synthase [Raineyella fluvialis]QGF24475.1 methionine synthase [Raineyella fluvialis]